MTRPHIVRADTLDLQDKTSPTAQDHSRQPAQPAPLGIGPAAPHQEASLQQVKEEREEEEENLERAWNAAGAHDDQDVHDGKNEVNGEQQLQQDEQAVRLNGGNTGDGEDGDLADAEVEDLDDDMMDKISSSPSIDDEDIDFEFVYALHTFVATVEGQANATKGDTMVLLDDSNSYWWLVRVVKDSSIGYLPAEHIETPTERLARLNKHRNIDLSATMLGDTAEKTKNPLKKAMRRRNAKTVQFAAPTYVSASEYEYSSDEDNDTEDLFGGANPQATQNNSTDDGSEPNQDDGLKVEPLKVGGSKKEGKASTSDDDQGRTSTDDPSNNGGDKERTSDEISDRPRQKVSRNGTLRNTDSFFKDDTAETRKITLTPNLLRDDSSTSTTDSKERGPSLESLEKNGFADKVKEDKKKKEKKPGMLSGLFKRKDKKSKQDSGDSYDEKQSEELGRGSPQSKNSDDSPIERPSSEKDSNRSPQRQPSKGKLQKPQRDVSPSKNKRDIPETESPEPIAMQNIAPLKPRTNGQPAASSMRIVAPERDESQGPSGPVQPIQEPAQQPDQQPAERSGPVSSTASKLNPVNLLSRKEKEKDSEPRPEKVKKAKQRVQLDDFDTSEDEEQEEDPFADPEEAQQEAAQKPVETAANGRLSESPVQISPSDAQPPETELSRKISFPDPQHPPDLTGDTSSQDSSSPISTPPLNDSPSASAPSASKDAAALSAESPTTINAANVPAPPSRPAPIPTETMQHSPPDSSTSSNLPAWSDASLRSYLDDGSDIRDMLMIIHDKSNVAPVGPEHPIMAGLFVEERNAMKELGGNLDKMLTEWIERKRKRSLQNLKAGR